MDKIMMALKRVNDGEKIFGKEYHKTSVVTKFREEVRREGVMLWPWKKWR